MNLLHPYFPCLPCVLLRTEHCIFLLIKLGQRQQHHLFDIFRVITHHSLLSSLLEAIFLSGLHSIWKFLSVQCQHVPSSGPPCQILWIKRGPLFREIFYVSPLVDLLALSVKKLASLDAWPPLHLQHLPEMSFLSFSKRLEFQVPINTPISVLNRCFFSGETSSMSE